jgi:hypothetical protein
LTNDARTATLPRGATESTACSPPVVDARVASPPCTVAVGEGGAVGDVRVPASPKIIDVDPISCKPGGADDLVKDQPQIE